MKVILILLGSVIALIVAALVITMCLFAIVYLICEIKDMMYNNDINIKFWKGR